jgi:hypothetical protein
MKPAEFDRHSAAYDGGLARSVARLKARGALVSNPSADIQVASNGHSHDFSFSIPTSTNSGVPPGMALNYIFRI